MSIYVALVVRASKDKTHRGVSVKEKESQRGRDRVSVKEQTQRGRDYAARLWPGMPVELFEDNNKSAAVGADRSDTEFERFREWILDGRIGQVWVNEQSRLSRSESGDDSWFELAADLHAAGITHIHTGDKGIVEVLGEVAGISAVLNAAELRRLKKRLRDHLQANAENGIPSGGTIFGYSHHDEHDRPYLLADGSKTMVIIPQQAEAIRWAAEKVQAGWSLSNIAKTLREQGLTGSHGGKIGVSAVKSMVTNPAVSGRRVHRGAVVGMGNWEPILDESTRFACESKLNGNRQVRRSDGGDYEIGDAHRGHAAGRKYVLTGGLAVCGVCEGPLTGSVKSRKKGVRGVPYLLCLPKGHVGIKYDEVERYVENKLFAEVDKPEFLDQYATDNHTARRDEITAALVAVDAKRNELARFWNLPASDPDALNTAEWQAARREQAKREQELRAELAAVPPPLVDIDIDAIRPDWPYMELDEKREVLRRLVKRVTVNRMGTKGGRVAVEWVER